MSKVKIYVNSDGTIASIEEEGKSIIFSKGTEFEIIQNSEKKEQRMSEESKCERVGDNFNNALRLLSDVVKMGDYVDYPVDYENVSDEFGNKTDKKGWRVIGIEEGEVKLVSAGIPLTYRYNLGAEEIERVLRQEFLDIPYSNLWGNYGECGFRAMTKGDNLRSIFPKEYTTFVRALDKEDIEDVIGRKVGRNNLLIERNDLLHLGEYYWLASAYNTNKYMWCVCSADPLFYDYGEEYGMRPVVYLKSNIQTNGRNANGAWKICVPELN